MIFRIERMKISWVIFMAISWDGMNAEDLMRLNRKKVWKFALGMRSKMMGEFMV